MDTREVKILNPMTGKFFMWQGKRESVFNAPYNIGVDRLD